MRPRILILLGVSVWLCAAAPARGETAAGNGWAPFPATAVFETGDTWVANGRRAKLYGVQACLRGTTVTTPTGQTLDCGEASLAMLASLVRDLRPICSPAARSRDFDFVVCVAHLRVEGRTTRVDLGTALVASGFAFAALNPDGRPVHEPYFVAEALARQERRGLHASADLPDPNLILLRTLRDTTPRPQPPRSRAP